jgi:hypothetical protein
MDLENARRHAPRAVIEPSAVNLDPYGDHNSYELHYSWGGHGGPYTEGYANTLKSAMNMLRGMKAPGNHYVIIRDRASDTTVAKVTTYQTQKYDDALNTAMKELREDSDRL